MRAAQARSKAIASGTENHTYKQPCGALWKNVEGFVQGKGYTLDGSSGSGKLVTNFRETGSGRAKRRSKLTVTGAESAGGCKVTVMLNQERWDAQTETWTSGLSGRDHNEEFELMAKLDPESHAAIKANADKAEASAN